MRNEYPYEAGFERQSRRHSIRGVDYAVHEWGDPSKPLLIHLHGFADTGSTFQFVVDQLADDWHIVAPDWRGFGRTKLRASSYWFPDYLADLAELVEVYSPQQPVRLVGHSMGANIASLYAGILPERVAAVVNIEGFGLPDSDPAEAPARYRNWIEAGRLPQKFRRYASFDELAERIRRRSPNMSMAAAQFVAREWAERREDDSVILRADPAHRLPNAVLYRRAEAAACWRRIDATVLLVTGSDSQFGERFGDAGDLPIPHTRSVEIAGAGHMIHFEQPQALATEIRKFFTTDL